MNIEAPVIISPRSPPKNLEHAEDKQGLVPEFILSAISVQFQSINHTTAELIDATIHQNFKEGREYYEASQFDKACHKFLTSMYNLANERSDSPRGDHHPDEFGMKKAIEFVNAFCAKHSDDIRSLCSIEPLSSDIALICMPAASYVDKFSSIDGVKLISNIEDDSNLKRKGVICGILADNVSVLAMCEEILGDVDTALALSTAGHRLQKVESMLF